jgi:hypothetical protein
MVAIKGRHLSPKTEFKTGMRGYKYLPIGARRIQSDGYVLIKVAEHGHSYSNWKAEHIIVVEQALGRKLFPEDKVHHIDFNPQNNTINNLYVCDGRSKHTKLHQFNPIIASLMEKGIVGFDKIKGEYYVC